MTAKKPADSSLYGIRNVTRPSSLIASRDDKEAARRRRNRAMTTQHLTYAALIEGESRRVFNEKDNERTLANRTSTLRDFMRRTHFSPEDLIGRELRVDFDEHARQYSDSMETDGCPRRALTNKLSELRYWRKLVVQWDVEQAAANDRPPPFTVAVRQLVGASPVARVAKQVGIPVDMLRGWVRGQLPRKKRCLPSVHRLETFYGTTRGMLTSLIPSYKRAPAPGTGEAPVVGYRKALGGCTQHPYLLRPASDSILRVQWAEFMRYKTAVRPSGLRRTERGRWRLSPLPLETPSVSNWWMFIDGFEVASADAVWTHVASYLGWLSLSVERGGKGMSVDCVQTLAWLAVPDHIEEYLRWKQVRAQGIVNGQCFTFLALLAALVRPTYGYLTQQSRFSETLPEAHRTQSWEQLCAAQFELVEALRAHFRAERRAWRNPFEPIAPVLELPQPMEAVVDMVARLRADRPVGGGRAEAVWARDMVLLKLLISNPLRRRNLAHLTWRQDNTGHLYRRSDGSWWLRVASKDFKNAAGAAGQNTYDTPILEQAWTDIERYITHFRPMLMREDTDLFLLSSDARGNGPHKPWKDLNLRVYDLTRRYLWRCPGIGAQAFRHLVATSVLKATGNDYKTVALLLNDKMATVEKHYGFITSGDASTRMAAALKGPLSRL